MSECEEEKPLCHLNTALFKILLMNLITNAIKYNTADAPEIRIGRRLHSNKLLIAFEDNGIGFEPRERKKIFKKFYQIGRSDDMTAKGSGIGLYLAQSIARIHKGRIGASSRGPDKGAVFTLSLPIP